MDPDMVGYACRVLWPPGSNPANDVKLAAAEFLIHCPGHAVDMGTVATRAAMVCGAPVNQLLHPQNLSSVLQQDPSFIVAFYRNKKGQNSIADVQLDVQHVLHAADTVTSIPRGDPLPPGPQYGPTAQLPGPFSGPPPAALGPPILSWQEDRDPYSPPGLNPHMQPLQPAPRGLNPYAEPFVPGAVSFAPPGPQPVAYPRQQQREPQGQHSTATYEMQLEQQDDGSYIGCLAGYNGADISQFSSSPAGRQGGRRKVKAKRSGAGGSNDPDHIDSLLRLLPMTPKLKSALQPYINPSCEPFLVDLAADLGRNITLRLSDKSCVELPVSLNLDAALQQLEHACSDKAGQAATGSGRATRSKRQGPGTQAAASTTAIASSSGRQATLFSDINRLGVPGSLHRISAMRDRAGAVFGLTYRVGRHIPGVADLLADVLSIMRAAARGADSSSSRAGSLVPSIASQPSKSLLLLGRPGVGKTTLLRDVARLMSLPHNRGGLGMSVVIVDTSNEIAGDNYQPHPCIGNARRMMVPQRHQQASVMIEAVMNHTPEVVIVDEIATREEAAACRTIAQRGVLLVSTAHGNSLGDLLRNPDLQGLMGGVKAVTLGDRLAHDKNGGHKTRLERAGGVTFGSVVEIMDTNRWRLHPDVAQSVDALLAHSCSTGSSTSDLEVPQHVAPGVETQLRSRVESSEGSKLLVSFESGRIPMTAVWADGGAPPAAAAQFHAGPAGMHQQVGNKRGRTEGGFDGHQYQYQQQQHNQQQQRSKKAKKGAGPQHWMSKTQRKKKNHQMVLQRLQKKEKKKQRKAAMAAARAAMQRY